MSKTPEEKAREYAIKRHGTHIAFEPDRFESRVAYLEGYHSRDEEVKAYRESLKTIIELAKEVDWDMNTKEKFRSNVRLWQALKDAKDLLK